MVKCFARTVLPGTSNMASPIWTVWRAFQIWWGEAPPCALIFFGAGDSPIWTLTQPSNEPSNQPTKQVMWLARFILTPSHTSTKKALKVHMRVGRSCLIPLSILFTAYT
jgi:hypothetical protein